MTIKQQGGVFGRNPTFNDVSVDDTLLVSNQIAVGTNTPVAGMALTLDGVGNYHGITLKANGSIIASFQQETSGNLYITTGFTGTVGTGKNLFIRTNGGSSVFTFKNSGDLAFASGNGIDFSATSGTGTSELFDDYEEGTWTPVAADAETGGNTGTAGVANGYYTKVGNVVYVMGVLSNVNTTGLTSGNLFYIQGLPFSSKDLVGATAYYMSGGVLTSAVTITGNVQMYLNDLSKTAVGFYDAGGNILVSDLTSAAADFYFSLTYMAA